jgi:hypothetical protein
MRITMSQLEAAVERLNWILNISPTSPEAYFLYDHSDGPGGIRLCRGDSEGESRVLTPRHTKRELMWRILSMMDGAEAAMRALRPTPGGVA